MAMGMRRALLASLCALAALSGARLVWAGTAIKMDAAELARRADCVVYGKVTGLRAGKLPGRRLIFTEVTMKVTESWKGREVPTTLVFRHLGGALEGRRLLIPGAASFELNEESVLFLSKEHPVLGIRMTIGLAQGKFRVSTNRGSGERVLSRQLGALDLVDAEGAAAVERPKLRTLGSLRAAVKRAVATEEAR